jgi:hypothetical protein
MFKQFYRRELEEEVLMEDFTKGNNLGRREKYHRIIEKKDEFICVRPGDPEFDPSIPVRKKKKREKKKSTDTISIDLDVPLLAAPVPKSTFSRHNSKTKSRS